MEPIAPHSARSQDSAPAQNGDGRVDGLTILDADLHMQQRLEASYRNLDRTLGSVTHADNKALIALTFQGAILAGLALIAGFLKSALQGKHNHWLVGVIIGFLVAFFICFCLATLRLFQTISPRIARTGHQDDHPSLLFFFGGIAGMGHDRFSARMHTITPEEIFEGVVTVTYSNALIAKEKFENLRHAYVFLGQQLVLYVVVVLLSVLPINA
jgi:hypothetical protein